MSCRSLRVHRSKCIFITLLVMFITMNILVVILCVPSNFVAPWPEEEGTYFSIPVESQANQPRCRDLPTHYPDSIPPLVHWTSKDGRVPSPLIPLVKSWRLLMTAWPTSWRFMHWDDNQIGELIKTHYPQLVSSYSKLVNGLERSDIGRLVVLHHVGGVYVDMDVELRRDLSPLLRPSQHLPNNKFTDKFNSSTCCTAIFSQEPIEHAVLLFNMQKLIANDVMLARANHSFLNYFLREWPSYFEAKWANNTSRLYKDAVYVTGPIILHDFYERYRNLAPENRPPDWSGAFLAEPQMFNPMLDVSMPEMLRKMCSTSEVSSPELKPLCLHYEQTNFQHKPVPSESFTAHRYMHLSYTDNMDMANSRHIRHLLPLLKCKI